MSCLCCWNRRPSSPGSSTNQKESFAGPGRPCQTATSLSSLREIKSYKAFSKIHKAATRGDVATVERRLILRKNDTNDRDSNDRTILHYASAYGHPNIVALLIEWNCDIDLRDSDNSTALIKASQYKHEECVAMLLEHGADPNAVDNSGNTALHYAVWHNSTSMTAKLLAHRADNSIKNKDSFTPLTLALTKNNDSMAKLLEDQKEKIKELDELDRSSKKTSNEKEEVKEQVNHIFELNELISPQGNAEDCELYSPDTILHYIEQVRKQRKDIDSEILVKIWGAVYSYKRAIEYTKHKCELIEEENERISNDIIAQEEDWAHSEIENAELGVELYNLREGVEKEELEVATSLQANENGELSRTSSENDEEDQFKLYQSLTQRLHEVQKKNRELEEEIDRYMDLCTMMEKDSDAHQNGEFSGYSTSSTSHCKKDKVLKLREKLESIETKLQQELFHCQCKEEENNLLEQKSAEMRAAQEKCEAEEGRMKQLEEKILNLKTNMDKNMVERNEVENQRKAIEEQYRSQVEEVINQVNQFLQERAASEQQKEQERQDYIMSLDHRHKEIEAEIVETNSRTISLNTERRLFENKYRAELKLEEQLKYELENINSIIVQLEHTKSRLASERRMDRQSHIHTHHRSVFEGTSDRSLQNDLGFNRTGGHDLSPRSRRRAWWDSLIRWTMV